jgi:hypothetical protein
VDWYKSIKESKVHIGLLCHHRRRRRRRKKEGGGGGYESYYHIPRYLVVVMKSKRKRWVQHIVHVKKGEKYCWNVNFKLQRKRPFWRIIFR